MYKKVLYFYVLSSVLLLCSFLCLPLSVCAMDTKKQRIPLNVGDDYATVFTIGQGLNLSAKRIKKEQKDSSALSEDKENKPSEAKKIYRSLAFAGKEPGIADIDHFIEQAKRGADVRISVHKRILNNPILRAQLDALVKAGGKVYVSSIEHGKEGLGFVSSANTSNLEKYWNQEAGVYTNDPRVLKQQEALFEQKLPLLNLYAGTGFVPDTPEKKKEERERAFKKRKAVDAGDTVISSYTHDIAGHREKRLKEVQKGDAVHIETMTGVPGGLQEAALSGADIFFVMDATGVNRVTRDTLKALLKNKNVTVYARKKDVPGCHHPKIVAIQQKDGVHLIEISTQNNAVCSGKELNTSYFGTLPHKEALRERQATIRVNPDFVPLSPGLTRFDAAHPKKKRKVGAAKRKIIFDKN